MKAQPTIRLSRVAAIGFLLIWSQAAQSQSFSSGSTGADGALTVPSVGVTTVTVRAGGVYNHTTVNIPSGGTLRFLRGADNSPVVILATGDVTISGTVLVSGTDGVLSIGGGPAVGSAGGPGGFSGGNGGVFNNNPAPTAGHGPGGGAASTGSGAQGGTYGASASFVTLVPLFGGSGGGGGVGTFTTSSSPGGSGGGGGGAILIASSTRITVNGAIRANGGNAAFNGGWTATQFPSAGTGGAIRLVAPDILGTGNVNALKGSGGAAGTTAPSDGRIRFEATNVLGFTGTTNPVPSVANAPGPVSPAGNPALANVPTLAVASVGGVAPPATPGASYFSPDVALAPGTTNPIPVVLNATNTPVGSPTAITLKLLSQGSTTSTVIPTADHTGTFASSSASANVTFPVGQVSVVQAFAAMTLTGQTASLFPLIDGEPVEQVAVAATLGQPSAVSLVTKSGREVRLDQLTFEDQLRVARAWEVMKVTRVE